MNAIINKALTCMCTFGQFNQDALFQMENYVTQNCTVVFRVRSGLGM